MYLYIIACWLLSALTSGITASPISDNDLSIRDSTTDSSFLNPLIAGFSQGKCPALVPVGLTKVLGCKTIVSGCIQGANSFYAAIGISPICVKQTDNYDPSAYTSKFCNYVRPYCCTAKTTTVTVTAVSTTNRPAFTVTSTVTINKPGSTITTTTTTTTITTTTSSVTAAQTCPPVTPPVTARKETFPDNKDLTNYNGFSYTGGPINPPSPARLVAVSPNFAVQSGYNNGDGGDLTIAVAAGTTSYLLQAFDALCGPGRGCTFTVTCQTVAGASVSFPTLAGVSSSQEGFLTFVVPAGGPYTSCRIVSDDPQTVQFDNIVYG